MPECFKKGGADFRIRRSDVWTGLSSRLGEFQAGKPLPSALPPLKIVFPSNKTLWDVFSVQISALTSNFIWLHFSSQPFPKHTLLPTSACPESSFKNTVKGTAMDTKNTKGSRAFWLAKLEFIIFPNKIGLFGNDLHLLL